MGRLHLDFTGPFQGQMWFILVDAYSKWLEVAQLSTIATAKIVSISPYCSSSNGEAEYFVQTFKRAMQREKGDVQLTLSKFLVLQNNTTLSNQKITSRTGFR